VVVAVTPNVPEADISERPVASSAAGRFVDGVFTSDAGSRRWRLWVPAGYDGRTRLPLVVLLHGCTQDPDDIARGTRVTEQADKLNLLVLLPEQPASANPKKCWNWYDAAHQHRDAGEPSLIAGTTRQTLGGWSVDSQRVYVAGVSAGAAMASVMAIAYPDVYAAAGLHSGIPYRAAANVMEGVAAMSRGASDPTALGTTAIADMGPRARAIPVIIVQGAADPVVKPVNAEHTRDMWLAMNDLSLGADARKAAPAGPMSEQRYESGGLRVIESCYRSRAGKTGCDVITLFIDGLGHAWSGGSRAGTFTDERGPDATEAILRFLLEQRMPGAADARRP
jgi:poly(hydroxyalkanoate) depolymerase family esterase